MNIPNLIKLSIILAGIIVHPLLSSADTWQQSFNALATTEYESNPLLTPTTQGSVVRTIYEPNFTLGKTFGLDELQGGLGFTFIKSSNTFVSQSRVNPKANFNWLHHMTNDVFGISGIFSEMSTRTTNIATPAGSVIPDATGLYNEDSTRIERTLSANWIKTLSERESFFANASTSSFTYSGGNFINYDLRSAGLKYAYMLNEQVTPFTSYSYIEQLYSVGDSTRIYYPIIGANWILSDRMSSSLQAGEAKGNGTNNLELIITAKYVNMYDNFTLYASHQTLPSGLGDFILSNQLNGTWSHELSQYNKIGVDLNFRKNLTVTDDSFSNTVGWIKHALNENWEVGLRYLYKTHQGGGFGSGSSNEVGIDLVYVTSNFVPIQQ